MSIVINKMIFSINNLCRIMFLAMNNIERWAKWVQDELDKRDWSQADLVRASKKSRGTISKSINGINEPDTKTVAAICDAFGYPREKGYRIVGILGPELNVDGQTQELTYYFHKLDVDNKDDVLDYAKNRFEKQERDVKKNGKRDRVT